METNQRQPRISFALFMLALIMGTCLPGAMLGVGLPMALQLILGGLLWAVIPFAIGWLTPSLWWLGAAGAFMTTFFALIAWASAPPRSLDALLMRWPLFLPLVLTLSFALVGRFFRERRERKLGQKS